MSRNLYLGADIITLATASDRNDFEQKAAALFQTVQQTDFNSRAELIADEIKRNKPDLIGLQEVALWRKGADGVKDGSGHPGDRGRLRLARRSSTPSSRSASSTTSVVRKQAEFDFEGPTALGHDIRFTQQDAILVRVDRNIKVEEPEERELRRARSRSR